MKAIRKSDGKVIEVREWFGTSDVVYSDPDMNRFYQASELDFNVDKSEEVTVNGWVARNKDNSLYIFKAEPWYNSPRGYWDDRLTSIGCFSLSPELFPQITFDNSPMEVTITIKPKKKQ